MQASTWFPARARPGGPAVRDDPEISGRFDHEGRRAARREPVPMKQRSTGSRRRPAVHITLARAARLHRLVSLVADGERTREQLLATLRIGLRTFYRELELLRRCGVKVRLEQKQLRFARHSRGGRGPAAVSRPPAQFCRDGGTGPLSRSRRPSARGPARQGRRPHQRPPQAPGPHRQAPRDGPETEGRSAEPLVSDFSMSLSAIRRTAPAPTLLVGRSVAGRRPGKRMRRVPRARPRTRGRFPPWHPPANPPSLPDPVDLSGRRGKIHPGPSAWPRPAQCRCDR